MDCNWGMAGQAWQEDVQLERDCSVAGGCVAGV